MTSLVDSLRPAGRDQLKIRDRILRASCSGPEVTAKGNSTLLQWDMGAFASFSVALSGDSSSFGIDGSNDLISWFPIDAQVMGVNNPPVSLAGFYQENSATVGSVAVTTLVGNRQSRFMRLRASVASSTRNTSVVVTLSQTPFTPMRPTKHLGPDNTWAYVAASGGVTTNAAQTLKAAVNAYHRNLITSLQLTNAGSTGTEVAITDAAGSIVLWRGYVAAGASLPPIQFDPPLRASANSALTLTLSASTGAIVYANASGLVALA